jgi:hypothetical protein
VPGHSTWISHRQKARLGFNWLALGRKRSIRVAATYECTSYAASCQSWTCRPSLSCSPSNHSLRPPFPSLFLYTPRLTIVFAFLLLYPAPRMTTVSTLFYAPRLTFHGLRLFFCAPRLTMVYASPQRTAESSCIT